MHLLERVGGAHRLGVALVVLDFVVELEFLEHPECSMRTRCFQVVDDDFGHELLGCVGGSCMLPHGLQAATCYGCNARLMKLELDSFQESRVPSKSTKTFQ